MGARGENDFHHLRSGGPTVSRPTDQPLRGPFRIMTVSRGHVRSDRAVAALKARAQMARHTGPFVEEFHHPGTHAHLELLFDEGIGHRIVVAFNFYVIINIKCARAHWP
jgi:hypothetical protein